jgi:hypothetical protein
MPKKRTQCKSKGRNGGPQETGPGSLGVRSGGGTLLRRRPGPSWAATGARACARSIPFTWYRQGRVLATLTRRATPRFNGRLAGAAGKVQEL